MTADGVRLFRRAFGFGIFGRFRVFVDDEALGSKRHSLPLLLYCRGSNFFPAQLQPASAIKRIMLGEPFFPSLQLGALAIAGCW